jgi:hypothetical protein
MLSACHSIDSKIENNHLSGERPPSAYIEIDNKRFETKLGTYCWQTKGKGICVDTAGPVELLEVKIVLGPLRKDIRMGYLADA